jgi:D-alanine-D-alanine ligase
VRIAVIYDAAADGGGTVDVAGVLESVHAVVATLADAGHAAFPVPVAAPLDRFLTRAAAVDLVFNLAEGLGGWAEDEPRIAAMLELCRVRFTGSSSDTLSLCRRKDRVNGLLAAHGLPVPAWTVVEPETEPGWGDGFPVIVKPIGEDGSVGIHEWSVADDALELQEALGRQSSASLVQRFVGGRELNVAFVGDAALPVAEIEFAGRQRVVSYAAKWDAGSDADRATRPSCPARIPARLRDRAVELARGAWAVVGGRGYGRVDLRTDDAGRIYVLEVNPNPDLGPGAGLARMADAAGWGYGGLVRRIVEEARP